MSQFGVFVLDPLIDAIKKHSDRNALVIGGKTFSYKDLGECISKIRKVICSLCFENRSVGLVVNDDLETYASIFALWLEGCCYVPLHPQWPIGRCLNICEDVAMDLMLDSSENSRYSDGTYHVLKTIGLPNGGNNLESMLDVADNELAYILFTSGSTGKPKGVPLLRKNLASFVSAFFEIYNLDRDDRCLQCFDLTFDLSIISYLVPLLRGACVYVIPSGELKYIQIGTMLEKERLTFALMAPSTIRYLRPYFNEIDGSSLRYSLFCGEALPLDVTEKWSKCAFNAVIDNVYGPTEDTIWCSSYRFDRNGKSKSYCGTVSIGKPIQGCEMEIFDECHQIVENGKLGELCLSGEQLTPGYLNNPQKNAESFFEAGGVRWYRSGDLCFKDADGDIMYSGRLDHQAKIQGFRVEMGEIEFYAKEYLKGANVVCLAYDNKDGLTEIAMFIESEEEPIGGLVSYLKTKMPHYMIPSKFLFVPLFPINNNAKTDRNILRTMIIDVAPKSGAV